MRCVSFFAVFDAFNVARGPVPRAPLCQERVATAGDLISEIIRAR
jgi:hypothetical protein